MNPDLSPELPGIMGKKLCQMGNVATAQKRPSGLVTRKYSPVRTNGKDARATMHAFAPVILGVMICLRMLVCVE